MVEQRAAALGRRRHTAPLGRAQRSQCRAHLSVPRSPVSAALIGGPRPTFSVPRSPVTVVPYFNPPPPPPPPARANTGNDAGGARAYTRMPARILGFPGFGRWGLGVRV